MTLCIYTMPSASEHEGHIRLELAEGQSSDVCEAEEVGEKARAAWGCGSLKLKTGI